jgi:hypothetical protein
LRPRSTPGFTGLAHADFHRFVYFLFGETFGRRSGFVQPPERQFVKLILITLPVRLRAEISSARQALQECKLLAAVKTPHRVFIGLIGLRIKSVLLTYAGGRATILRI